MSESKNLSTRICELFGVRYPIVQTGMGWVAGARLASATSNAGGLGIIAAATMSLGELDEAMSEVARRTDNPYGVNMRTDQADTKDRAKLIASRGVKVVSFAQAPNQALVEQLRQAGVVTVATVGAPRHAIKVASIGVDCVIAQGGEGGGHTGAIPTSLLLPSVVDSVDIPVIGAGGFYDGRGLVAALAYGAQGIAMGTRFLLSLESTVPDVVKAKYLAASLADTVVTTAIDGAPQRVIITEKIRSMEKAGRLAAYLRAIRAARAFQMVSGESFLSLLKEGKSMKSSQELSWSQVIMAASAPMLTKAAMVEGNLKAGILPTGQVVGEIDSLPSVQEIIDSIVVQAEEILEKLRTA